MEYPNCSKIQNIFFLENMLILSHFSRFVNAWLSPSGPGIPNTEAYMVPDSPTRPLFPIEIACWSTCQYTISLPSEELMDSQDDGLAPKWWIQPLKTGLFFFFKM